MGNNQSSPNPNRLSKPKTNTNSPSPALKVDSPVSVSSRYADLSAKGRQQIRETLLSPIDTEVGSPVCSSKEDAASEPVVQARGRPLSIVSRSNSRTNSRTNSRSNSLSCFGSRHGSNVKLPALSDSKISLVSATQVDLEGAIKLLQEVKKNASPEDIVALQEALEQSEEHAVPISEDGITRRNSVMNRSSSSLTRRRSLIQTPGVATRSSPIEGRRRTWNSWKAPKLDPEEEAKWRTTPRSTYPLHRLTALDLAEDARETSTPRAQTPGEMDYSHLGSLKLGSLVVTNGAPSPAPSAKALNKASQREDDYFSAGETSSSPLMMKTTRRRGHAKSKSSVLPTTAPFYSELHVHNGAQVMPRPKQVQTHSSLDHQLANVLPEVEPIKQLRVMNKTPDRLAHDSTRLAQSYQAEIPTSPFELKPVNSAPQDEGFVSDDAMSLREEVTRMLDDTIFAEPEAIINTTGTEMSLTAPTKPPSNKKKSRAGQRPPPRTADSGYSSGGSLRVAERKQQKDVQPKPSALSPVSLSPVSLLHDTRAEVEQTCMIDTSKQSTQMVVSKPLPAAPLDSTTTQRRQPSLLILDISARSSVRSSTSEAIISPQTPRSVASKASFDSTSSTAQKRLQRRRPSQPELPVVQSCQPIPEGTIPDVPENIRAKFTRRLSHTPGMECLTQTYPTKDHEFVDDPATDSSDIGSSQVSQLAELEPQRPPTPPVNGRLKSLSLFRRKSTPDSKKTEGESENASFDVVDLGTIASSLGQSPYDAAMSNAVRKTVTSPTHPHQLGSSLPRAKSMVRMDSKAAAELARIRSKDRALTEEEMPPQRRRSYHNLKMEAGEAKASKRRPQSVYHNIPPVPSLDGSKSSGMQTVRPDMQHGGHKKTKSDLSYSARSRERAQVVSGPVDKDGQYSHSDTQHGVNWEVHSRAWSQRRKSIGEGLRTKHEITGANASVGNSRTMSPPPEDMAAWGRYSGGLGYGYEGRGAGVGGSAGTRSLHSYASNKSLQWRNQYGVDLSDVPIVLQRV